MEKTSTGPTARRAALQALDRHFAAELGCRPADLRGGRLVVVCSARRDLRFAKGFPLPLFGLDSGEGCVISVAPALLEAASEAARRAPEPRLSDEVCRVLEETVGPLAPGAEWFRGVRLYLTPEDFRDARQSDVREASGLDDRAAAKRLMWGGPVFAQFVDGRAVSRAAVKPLSEVVWDLSVETDPAFRGKGYARSAASAALQAVFAAGKVAAWATDRDNEASLRTARALGFREYALEVGCFVG